MRLGFVSAVFADLALEEVVAFAAVEGFSCLELMCWPPGKAERRYAGVTHIDVTQLGDRAVAEIRELLASNEISISGLGYYPNPLAPDAAESRFYTEHLKSVIQAAATLGVPVVNTFIGRDPAKTVAQNWPRMLEVWRPLVAYAESRGVRIAIENCPMLYTADEWPGGKNLAYCPAIWRRLFTDIPSPSFGLNYDPSHLVWQQIDYCRPLREFSDRIFHVHAKDVRIDRQRLDDVGILAAPLEYHTPCLPGRGQIDWKAFLAELAASGYDGSVCIEVEDRQFEGSLETRKEALRASAAALRGTRSEI